MITTTNNVTLEFLNEGDDLILFDTDVDIFIQIQSLSKILGLII